MDLLSILDGTPEPPIVALNLGELNTSGEYHLATPMYEFQKELTDQIVSLHYPDILKYCETDDTTDLITKLLQICVENCLLVATHPYLLIRHYMPKNLASKELPAKLAETSGKFSVLKNLVSVFSENKARWGPKHAAVVLSPEHRLFDLVEALLLGCPGPKSIVRYVGNNVKKDLAKAAKSGTNNQNGTTIHLIPSDGAVTRKDLDLHAVKFDVVIAVDTFDTQLDFMARLRCQNRGRGHLPAAIIHLIPMFSIEHCLAHYKGQEALDNYLYNLVLAIVCMRDQIGNLPPDLHPIYNQNLTYLSHTFFDHALCDTASYPAWPLPGLPPVPSFSPSDVERSLLTEVVYHYTPYDSSDTAAPQKKKTFYEKKRLQLDYVTNPLRNDYNALSGIHNHRGTPNGKGDDILTHLLIMELNENHTELALLKEEYDAYKAFNLPEKQALCGRRSDEIKKTLAAIIKDVDHAQQRVHVTQKKTLKRAQENEELAETQKRLKRELTEFASRHDVKESATKTLFVEKQLRIWTLQNEIKNLVASLKVKAEEKNYMKKEVGNCTDAMIQSETQIHDIKLDIDNVNEKLAMTRDQEERANAEFQRQRDDMLMRVAAAEKENAAAREKFAEALSVIKETSHLKKRKGRGVTPIAR